MEKLKILHLIYYPGSGGAEEYIYLLSSQLQKQGYKVFVIYSCKGRLLERLKKLGVLTQKIKMRHPFDLFAAFKLYQFLKKEKIDICHTHFLRENFIAALAGKIANVPVIWTVHRQDPQKLLVRFFNRIIMSLNFKIIAVSKSVQEYLLKLGVKESKIELIYNGVLVPETIETKFSKKDLGIPESHLIVGSIGRVVKEKGFDVLLKAAEILKNQDVSFVVIGEGPEQQGLEEEKKNRELKNVYFLGAQRAYSVLPLFDIFVLPSHMEAMPLVILEAMAFKKAVIAPNVGGVPEVIENQKNGLLFLPGNAQELASKIKFLLENHQERETLSRMAYKTIKEKFTVEKMSQKVLDLYSQAAKELS